MDVALSTFHPFNATDESLISDASFMCTLYVNLGLAGAACSIFNMLVVCSCRDLRQKSSYTIVLNIGELCDAISYVLVGLGRRQEMEAGTLFTQTTVHNCFVKKYWPHSLILGTELPAFCMLLSSCWRLLLVTCPDFHDRISKRISEQRLLLSVPIAGLVSLFTASLSVYLDGERVVETQHCFIIDSTAAWFSTIHFVMSDVGFLAAFVALATELHFRKVRLQRFRVSQRHRTLRLKLGALLAATGFSTVLVAMPATLMIFKSLALREFDDVTVSVTYAMPGVVSIINTFLNFAFQNRLRRRVRMLFGYECCEVLQSARRDRSQSHSHGHFMLDSLDAQIGGPLPEERRHCWATNASGANFSTLDYYGSVNLGCRLLTQMIP